MADAHFGYLSAYYNNRSNAVVVFGKVWLTWLNSSYYVTPDALCDFYSEYATIMYSVRLHYRIPLIIPLPSQINSLQNQFTN